MTLQTDAAAPTVIARRPGTAPAAGPVVPGPRTDSPPPWAPPPFDALAGHPAGRTSHPAEAPAGLVHPGYPAPAPLPPSGPSTGRIVGIVAAVVGAIVVLLVVGGIALTMLFSVAAPVADTAPAAPPVAAPAQPAAPAPSAAQGPASQATARTFNAAGKRLDAAKTRFDAALTRASEAGDRQAFGAAAGDLATELRIYRDAIAGLPLADQQQAVTSTLLPRVDATIADCEAMVAADGQQELSAAAKRFDTDWEATASLHNQINTALPAI